MLLNVVNFLENLEGKEREDFLSKKAISDNVFFKVRDDLDRWVMAGAKHLAFSPLLPAGPNMSRVARLCFSRFSWAKSAELV